jgi:hypothetical protein
MEVTSKLSNLPGTQRERPGFRGVAFLQRIGGYPRSAYGLGGAGAEAGFGVVEAGLVAAGLAGAAEALAG